MGERVAIFIDGSNLYHALKENCGRADINFADFARKLCGDRQLFRIYYYNVLQDTSQRTEGHRDQADFLDALRKVPCLEIRLGGTKLSQGVTVEKGIDIMLATDVINFAWKNVYDAAVIVSGDADFAYALRVVKDMGKHVEVANFESNVSKDLLDLADSRHLLSRDYFKSMWTAKSRRHRPHRRGNQRQLAGEARLIGESDSEAATASEPPSTVGSGATFPGLLPTSPEGP